MGGILKRMFPHRYSRTVRRAQRTDPNKRPQSVAALSRLMRPKWGLWLLPVLLIGILCFWMHPDGKRFPVTLDTGQTVYARVLSHWHRTVAFVSPSDAMTWNDIPNAPSGDMVIPADIRHRGLRYRVVGVDSCAFHNCNKLTHVTFPEGLERIGFRAFSGCIMIQDTITIPKSLRNIEPFAFADCNSITTLARRRIVSYPQSCGNRRPWRGRLT